MRTLLLPLAVAGLLVVGMAGCDVDDDDTSTTTDTTTPLPDTVADTVAPDTVVTPTYFAIFLEDRWDERCASSSVGAHGADIDAVELLDGTSLVGYLDVIDSEFDESVCGAGEYGYTDTAEAKGAPNGELTANFYSLAGGWLIGEFENQAQIVAGYTLKVTEIDDEFCGGISSCIGTEDYDVFIATDLDCVNTGPEFRNSCMIQITGADGASGTATLPLSGF